MQVVGDRLELYKQALKQAEAAGEGAKARRYKRSIASLEQVQVVVVMLWREGERERESRRESKREKSLCCVGVYKNIQKCSIRINHVYYCNHLCRV